MDIKGVVPLDEQSLLDTATRNTGLSDFGADVWREPFRVIVNSLEQDANLNLMGRLTCRSELLLLLEGRLQIEDTYKRYPEIDDEQIVQPIFVLGQGRSGTSLLLNLLEQDPDNGAIRYWEGMLPCPPPEKATYHSDPRIERGDKLITQWIRVAPPLEGLHEFGGTVPAECVQTMAFSFLSIHFAMMGQVSSYLEYLAGADWSQSYAYHKRVLKLLQWKNPRRHWALKATEHLRLMPELLKTFPDACLIWSHRDPIRAVASAQSLAGTFNWMRSDHPISATFFDNYTKPEMTNAMLTTPIGWIESGVVPQSQLCNIQYLDLVADPVGTVRRIYDYFQLPVTAEAEKAFEDYMTQNPRTSRPPHKYSVADETRPVFQRYQAYFGVPSEL